MKNTILASVVAVLCTAALCCTLAFTAAPKANTPAQGTSASKYMTESEAAEYIGVSENVMKMLRADLKYFEGAYETYTYTDDSGEMVTDIVYRADLLDKKVEAYMGDSSGLNFKYIEENASK